MKIGVLLAGCGVYDGSEIQEAVFTLLALNQRGAEVICMAPDVEQHHVVDHRTGNETGEKRNVLTEAARIARGEIKPLAEVNANDLDGLVIPGGFGAAKNLNKWAISGPEGEILPEVTRLIQQMVQNRKPIAGLCMGPTVISKALEGTDIKATLTVGSTEAASPYDIAGISSGMESLGTKVEMRTLDGIAVDEDHLIVSAPCYMMEGSISDIHDNIQAAMEQLISMIRNQQ